ncbi:response regulator [Denitrobaculum tricleocarpae]|uniref:Response regulator n=1 Tax=Denitrobaculum tricleocarpae TaxID=2591009 RepID=A0A545SYN0_9PROT|nr:response regulator [Denitrobaculum tricleocarpae]TQV70071.1 response regulator [Denitrobaculum tricleocarpae]
MQQGTDLQIMIVEDNPADAVLAREMLSDIDNATYHISTVARLDSALAELAANGFDAVLLDLTLPDAREFEGLKALLAEFPELAIVVLTGRDDESLGLEAIAEGAQDYLVKNRMTSELLSRSLRYAIERADLKKRLEEASILQNRTREMDALYSIVGETSMSATRKRFKSPPLKEAAPTAFSGLVKQYESTFDVAISEQLYRVATSSTDQFRRLADVFCQYRAGPKDVIDVHLSVLDKKVTDENPSPRQLLSLTQEARVVLVQVLGFVAEGYRTYAMWTGGPGNGSDRE